MAISPFTAVQKITLIAAVRVALLALLLSGITAWVVGETAAWIVGALTVFLCFVYYAWKLAQLADWLHDPRAANLPDGFGIWGDTLGVLYRIIRDQRIAQQAITTSLDRFQQAAAALPDGAVMLDNQYNIVWCNPNAETHWSVSLNRDRMQTITYLIRYPEFIEYLNARRFSEPLILKIAPPKVSASPASSAVELTLSVQLVAFGADQLLLLSRDISEREKLETMRRDFVANVSHELRTPLTVLLGFLETIDAAGENASNPQLNTAMIKKSYLHMSSQALRMQRLVDDLLALSRLEDNRNRLVSIPVNMQELVAALVVDAQQLSNGKHTFSSEIAEAGIIGNRDEIISALGNLVTNAVRYTPPGGKIEVRWAIDNGVPTFAVTDNGDGIAPEHIPRLTERFYRVDRGRSHAVGGTGLGLAIVKHVLLRHGARLEILSTQDVEFHGTTFRVHFPAERLITANEQLAPQQKLHSAE